MTDADETEEAHVGATELLAWVAGLAALTGLVAEIVYRSARDRASVTIGALLVAYVVYISLSIRIFWRVPRIAVPIMMLTGGALWTVALHTIDRSDLVRAVSTAVFIPLAMAYVGRRLLPPNEGVGIESGVARSSVSLAQALLDRGQGFRRGVVRRR